jgi:predicted nucleic acid-binding protein
MNRISLDSNMLIYAEGTDDVAKRDIILNIVDRIGFKSLILTMQAAGETMNWLVRKAKLSRSEAANRVDRWFSQAEAAPVSVSAFKQACRLSVEHQMQVWDAVILAASAEAGAIILMSEDMQHGFSWGGVTVVNPFMLSEKQRLSFFPENTIH